MTEPKLLIPAILILASFSPASAQLADQQLASATIQKYCTGCHNEKLRTGGLVLNPAALGQVGADAELWEKVVRRVRAQSMPPSGMPRPDAATYNAIASFLETSLDREAAGHPRAGEMPHLHRLTRTEYHNAIRDLLAVDQLPKEMDYEFLLPADNASSGFDNLADTLFVSPVIMERYLDAARKISRLALGDPQIPQLVNIFRFPYQLPQNVPFEGLPLGTRGGIATPMFFPLDAEYVFQVETVGRSQDQHQLEIAVDGERLKLMPVGGAGGRGRSAAPPIEFRGFVKAGPREVTAAFLQKTDALDETTLKPSTRTPGSLPAISVFTIRGPFKPTGPGDTPSRRRILGCQPKSASEEVPCARQVLATLARRAFRRPVTEEDVNALIPFYEAGRKERDFDLGIQKSVERILVSPQFLYRIERDARNIAARTNFRITDLELASRLSFFLWSSIPDDELLDTAVAGKLHEPAVLEQQTRRLLADSRSESMVNNFAAQWLYLRDLDRKDPDLFLFRDFDRVLKDAFEKETDLFLDSILRENRSVVDLLTANYTFVNERLAKHYGIPDVGGSYFRRVTFPEGSPRGGLLTQGSILTLTSYPNRTSPVLRGKYVLENLLGTPPPPPPPNIPALKTEGDSAEQTLTMRQAMEKHRASPACASCHARMDPIGFALENFDAVGQWREHDAGAKIDASGVLPNGSKINGVADLKKALAQNPVPFVQALTEKLMMYGLGRNVQYYDTATIRSVVKQSEASHYTLSSLVLGIVNSVPFQMREIQAPKRASVKLEENR